MNQYYLIPVTSRSIKIGDISLYEMLEEVDCELLFREKTRVELTYELGDSSKELLENGFIDAYNMRTSSLYQEKGIPEKIVIVKHNKRLYELGSNTPISEANDSYLSAFSVDPDAVLDVFEANSSYSEDAKRFIDNGLKRKKEKQIKKVTKPSI